MRGKVRLVLYNITLKDVITTFIPILIYFISIGIYLHPLTSAPTPSESPKLKQRWSLIYNPKPQLDELHIMSPDNHDISPQPTTLWTEAWHNDYWGRPLTFESSHKSWRPVSVWSFRFAKGGEVGRHVIAIMGKAIGSFMEGLLTKCGFGFSKGIESSYKEGEETLASELFVHRFINVIIHASIVQLVGFVATLLFSRSSKDKNNNNLQLYTRYISQLLFALHPVHVEAVVNVANRPHILALLFNVTIVDPDMPLIAMAVLASLGLLTAETAIFQFPAIVLTMTAIRYNEELSIEERKGNEQEEDDQKKLSQQQSESPIFKTIVDLLPRYMLLVIISVTYLLYRHYNDTLSIPDGLIRAAENPFYEKLDEWTLSKRIINYSYILSLHIMKSFGVDLVGFSHEYGYNCIPEIISGRDYRLILPMLLIFLVEIALVCAWYGWKIPRRSCTISKPDAREHEQRVQRILLTLVFFSWMATLFPISGILKVGTFVADRIAVASSFGTCIFVGRFFAVWIIGGNKSSANTNFGMKRLYRPLKHMVLFYVCVFVLAKRTHNRAAEWMDSVPLFESSLKTCPRSIKSNLEMSKLYSGLIPHMLDLDKALSLISTAQSIDPEYCDVHQQYAHCYFQQAKYISFEEEMVQSLMCKFTMGQAMTNWQNYWKVVLSDKTNAKARARYERYMAHIGDEIKRHEKKEKEERRRVNRSITEKEEL